MSGNHKFLKRKASARYCSSQVQRMRIEALVFWYLSLGLSPVCDIVATVLLMVSSQMCSSVKDVLSKRNYMEKILLTLTLR